eukprot:COSAG01_NODE_7425_length_3213_cov_52.478163_4_plen_146_part_00
MPPGMYASAPNRRSAVATSVRVVPVPAGSTHTVSATCPPVWRFSCAAKRMAACATITEPAAALPPPLERASTSTVRLLSTCVELGLTATEPGSGTSGAAASPALPHPLRKRAHAQVSSGVVGGNGCGECSAGSRSYPAAEAAPAV